MRLNNLFAITCAGAALLSLTSCGGSKDTTKVYDLGSRVEVGHLTYTVETQWQPQIGTGDTARVPRNRFFIIRLTAVNSGSEELIVPNMTLKDDQGNTVDELSEGDGVSQWLGFVRKVRPADSISGNVVFDAEPKHYRLFLSDENGDKSVPVDLPLSFSSEAPPMAVPGISNPSGAAPDFQTPPKK